MRKFAFLLMLAVVPFMSLGCSGKPAETKPAESTETTDPAATETETEVEVEETTEPADPAPETDPAPEAE